MLGCASGLVGLLLLSGAFTLLKGRLWPRYATIHEAAEHGSLADVKRHLSAGVDVDAKDELGCTPLVYAVLWGHLDVAEFLIDAGADIDGAGRALLIMAVRGQLADPAMVKLLIDSGADVSRKYRDGATALHWAACREKPDIAEVLIKSGADVNATSDIGSTPLHNAALTGRRETAELLIDAGADVNAKDDEGRTPLYYASQEGRQDVADLLRAHGATE